MLALNNRCLWREDMDDLEGFIKSVQEASAEQRAKPATHGDLWEIRAELNRRFSELEAMVESLRVGLASTSNQTSSALNEMANARRRTAQARISQTRWDIVNPAGTWIMRISVDFEIIGMLGVPAEAVAFFYGPSGIPLPDRNGVFRTVDGQVAVSTQFTPAHDPCCYSQLLLEIPTSELHTVPAGSRLSFQVVILSAPSSPGNLVRELARSGPHQFNY